MELNKQDLFIIKTALEEFWFMNDSNKVEIENAEKKIGEMIKKISLQNT